MLKYDLLLLCINHIQFVGEEALTQGLDQFRCSHQFIFLLEPFLVLSRPNFKALVYCAEYDGCVHVHG